MRWQEKTELRLRELGKTRQDLARHLARPSATVAKWFSRERSSEPEYAELLRIARYLDVTADWLIDPLQKWPYAPQSPADRTAQLVAHLRRALDAFTQEGGVAADMNRIVDLAQPRVDKPAGRGSRGRKEEARG